MEESTLSILLIWVFLFVYILAGALDFGSGFWAMIFSNQKNTNAGFIANKYLSPSWEVTNVFLIMFVVALVSFFPRATFTFGTVLLVPGSLILILISIRTSFLVFSHSVKEYRRALNIISGITGILVPALLVVVLPVTHGGFISGPNGYQELLIGKVFTSPQVYTFIGLAITTTLYLSAFFLADYSIFAGDKSAFVLYRKYALWFGPISLLLSILLLFTLNNEANWLYTNMINRWGWLGLSLLAFAIGYGSLFLARDDKSNNAVHLGLIATLLQYLLAGYVYGASHFPYLIYPTKVQESFTNLSMYQSLIYSYTIGTIILVPILIYHWRLFVRSKKYINQEDY